MNAASSPRRWPIVGVAALVAALAHSAPAPAATFLEGLFGGGEGSAHAPRREPRGGEAHAMNAPARARGEPHATKRSAKTSNKTSNKVPAKPLAEPAEPPPPPYDAQVQRLAEVLGGLSFLRDLCDEGDGDDWRGKMAQLRDSDAPSGPRRQRLTAAFNRGFHGYELTYRVCTPNARLVIARYLDEAENLSRDVASRYGNP